MKAIVSHGTEDFRLEERPVPEMDDTEVLVEIHFCGVCGTDIHMYHGTWELYPGHTPGHEASGIIRKVGAGVDGLSPGDRVAIDPGMVCRKCEYCRSARMHLCDNRFGMYHHKGGGFGEFTCVPAEQIYKLPDDLPLEWGAFLEPAGCCVHAIERAGIMPGQTVAVLGGGAIGLMIAQLALISGASKVILSEPQEKRRKIAETLGVTQTIDPTQTDAVEAVCALTGGGVDLVIESAGRAVTVAQCFDMVKKGGKIVLFGVNDPATRVEFSPYQVFRNEITILGSLMTNDVFPRTLALIASGRLQVQPLISHILPLERFHEALKMHQSQQGVKILIHPVYDTANRRCEK